MVLFSCIGPVRRVGAPAAGRSVSFSQEDGEIFLRIVTKLTFGAVQIEIFPSRSIQADLIFGAPVISEKFRGVDPF